jgi:orotidine-5'-phosphate decarboxylase
MKPLIIALDVDTEKEALSLIKETKEFCDIYKVGPGLFLRYGRDIIKKIQRLKKKIFLDLKFHDIPNTMLKAVKEAAEMSVFSATIHTSAGAQALKTISSMRSRPQIWGVTVLTSLSGPDLDELGFGRSSLEQTVRLAELAKRCHLNGIVASVGETAELRKILGRDMTIVTPGIRLPHDSIGDQKRIATPRHAKEAGSDFIVVGRPILESKNPGLAAEEIIKDWKKGDYIR